MIVRSPGRKVICLVDDLAMLNNVSTGKRALAGIGVRQALVVQLTDAHVQKID